MPPDELSFPHDFIKKMEAEDFDGQLTQELAKLTKEQLEEFPRAMNIKMCRKCDDLLAAWSIAVQTHSQSISRLVNTPMTHPGRARLESHADESIERAIVAREIYRHHREECADASALITDLLGPNDLKRSR